MVLQGVAEYLFQDQYVYVFSDGTCGADMGAAVYSQNCEYLGYSTSILKPEYKRCKLSCKFPVFQKKKWA